MDSLARFIALLLLVDFFVFFPLSRVPLSPLPDDSLVMAGGLPADDKLLIGGLALPGLRRAAHRDERVQDLISLLGEMGTDLLSRASSAKSPVDKKARYEEALRFAAEAVTLSRRAYSGSDRIAIEPLYVAGKACLELGYEEGPRLLAQCAAACRQNSGAQDLTILDMWTAAGQALLSCGGPGEALALEHLEELSAVLEALPTCPEADLAAFASDLRKHVGTALAEARRRLGKGPPPMAAEAASPSSRSGASPQSRNSSAALSPATLTHSTPGASIETLLEASRQRSASSRAARAAKKFSESLGLGKEALAFAIRRATWPATTPIARPPSWHRPWRRW